MKKFGWFIVFAAFVGLFLWKLFLKGYIIGPFDLLAGFYDPYQPIKWGSSILTQRALQYKNPLLTDPLTVIIPIKLFTANLFRQVTLPLWNPYILAGSPNLANVQSAVLYPLNIVYLFLPAVIAYEMYIILQLILSFMFMYLYLRQVKLEKSFAYFGALSFSFSSFFIVWFSWGTVGHAFLWLPLILFLIDKIIKKKERKYNFLFVVSLVLSFLAGHTQTTFMVWLTSLGYIFYRSRNERIMFLQFIFLSTIALLIASAQLLPSIEMYRQSARDIFRTESFYQDQTLYLSSYLQSIVPDVFGNPVTRNWWGKMNYIESAIYFGTIAFYFMIFQVFETFRQKKLGLSTFFIEISVIGIILSTQNIISHLVFSLSLPLVSSSTFSRYSALFIVGGSILAAFGLKNYIEKMKKDNLSLINLLNVIFIAMIGVYWGILIFKILPKEFINNLSIVKRNSIIPSVILIGTISLPYAFKIGQKLNPFKLIRQKEYFLLILLIIGILSLELFRYSYKFTPFAPRDFFYPDTKLVNKLQEVTKSERYIGYLAANINSGFQIRGVEGAEPLYDKHFGEIASLVKTGRVDLHDRAAISFPEGPYRERILDLMSVAYFVDKTDNFRNMWITSHGNDNKAYDDRFREIWTDGTFKIYQNKYALPRQHLFYSSETITDDKKLFSKLVDTSFNYQNQVITSDHIDGIAPDGEGTISVVSDTPQKQEYRIQTSGKALFVVTDTYYPGWNVYVDGVKTPIIRANHAFRAVPIDPGDHTVVFVYKPKSVMYGFMMSIAGMILLCAIIVPKSSKNNKK